MDYRAYLLFKCFNQEFIIINDELHTRMGHPDSERVNNINTMIKLEQNVCDFIQMWLLDLF